MDNVTFIDSAGLGTSFAAHHSVKTQGASLRLCHLGSKFQEVLQITKLLTVFDVYNTEAEAVASFFEIAQFFSLSLFRRRGALLACPLLIFYSLIRFHEAEAQTGRKILSRLRSSACLQISAGSSCAFRSTSRKSGAHAPGSE